MTRCTASDKPHDFEINKTRRGRIGAVMINLYEVTETNKMIEEENLDVRTITLGISLLDCIDSDLDRLNEKIYNKIYESKPRIW